MAITNMVDALDRIAELMCEAPGKGRDAAIWQVLAETGRPNPEEDPYPNWDGGPTAGLHVWDSDDIPDNPDENGMRDSDFI